MTTVAGALTTVAGYGKSSLSLFNMDSCKKIILPPKTYKSKYWNRNIEHFKKHKNNIFVCSGYGLERLNLDLSVAKTVHIGLVTLFLLDSQFFTANDTYVYTFYNNQLCVHNNELEFLKKVRQSNNPTGAFYLLTDMNQFESHKGMYYWLNNTNLQVLREDDGQLVKSVAVTANNFIIDSTDKVVLINNATKELNYFTADGILVDQIPLDNYKADLRVTTKIDGEHLFYSDTSIYF